jgi:transcriptional regulator with XRE-family HTH domain
MGAKSIEQKIGEVLQERRKKLGITRYRVSKDTGIHYGYLKDLEEGKRSMSIDMLNRLCEALGLEIKLELR